VASSQRADIQAVLEDRYTLIREVGEGGMATVFLARDLKHDRSVALKVLKPELGAVLGAERFLAEIRVTANLQHPHLLPLFDSGEAAGLLYYVMPFVDGESLRARLARERQLPIGEAVSIGVAVAGALDYAHRHGVVHRDLKPENILLQEGLPLVADFGVALAVSRAGGPRVTQTGLAVGTPQYMSPEQAAGERQLDARSDVYALGAVLYEMLTGEPPHVGPSTQVIVARVINEPPRSARATRPSIPEHVESAVMRALEKVPADRFATARELALALSPASSGSLTTRTPDALATAPRARRLRGAVVAMASAMILITGLTGWWWGSRERSTPRTARFVVSALPDQSGPAVLTPDGTNLVYVGLVKGRPALLVRRLDSLAVRELPGTDGAVSLLLSPDGRSIAYYTAFDELRKVPIEGGVSTHLATSLRFGIGSWGDNGVVVSDAINPLGLSWVSASGGAVHQLTRFDSTRKESGHFAPYVLPGGRGVVFRANGGRSSSAAEDAGDLSFVRLDESNAAAASHTSIGVRGRYAIALIAGWLLYAGEDNRSILAVRFDEKSGLARGEPITVLQEEDALIGLASLSRDGTLLYTRPRSITNEAKLVDNVGVARPLLTEMASASYMNPRLSPDGKRLAVQGSSPQGTDIWVYDIATQGTTRLTTEGNALNPAWTPDGRHLIYVKIMGGSELWRVATDGSTPPERILSADGVTLAISVQPDGEGMVFERRTGGRWSIWRAPVAPGALPRPLLDEPFDDYMPAISPDGHWLAYVSNSTGKYEVYARPYPSAGAATRISDGGGTEPRWSHDGRRIFYRNAAGLHAATLAADGSASIAARSTLFRDDFDGNMPHANYDVGLDDKSFVMLAPSAKGEAQMVLVVNWRQELDARLASAH
jgi:eukaryotic-like serine/threonine-protein kinase